MVDANGEEINKSTKSKIEPESSNSLKSFKEALLKVFGEEGLEEADWSELLDENLVEDRWYQNEDDTSNRGAKSPSSGPVITISDEELCLGNALEEYSNSEGFGGKVNFKLLENKIHYAKFDF